MMSHIRPILFGCFVLIVHGARAGVTQISTCPYTISQPGQYHVAKNLTCPVNGVNVAADGVQLYFDGHTLDGMKTGEFGVLVSGSNDSIFGGGTVTGFVFGMVIESLKDGPGELPPPTSGNRVVNITATSSGSHGIVVQNSVDNNIVNCIAIRNTDDGFFVGSDYNTLISNTANENQNAGIEIFSNESTLSSNETDGNAYGIFVDFGAAENVIQANSAHRNHFFDFADFNASCDSNTWKSNQFDTANQPCIH